MNVALDQQWRSPRVFVCFSFTNKDRVEYYCKRLERDGLWVWRSYKYLLPGENWKDQIEEALRASDIVLVFVSEDFQNTGYKHAELELALEIAKEKPRGTVFIVPIRIEMCRVPECLMRFQSVDLFRRGSYPRLLRGLRRQRRHHDTHQWSRRRTDRIRAPRSWTITGKGAQGYIIQDPISPRLFHCLVQRGAKITHLSQEVTKEAAFAQCDQVLDQQQDSDFKKAA